ncbi:MAG: Ig-like domain-containing protein [Marinilabiliaceae bacterium]|nr:Ig-like domain-containing protein [Marinilabiliaceae bacterium]
MKTYLTSFIVLLCLITGIQSPLAENITFHVDLSSTSGFDAPSDKVYITGSLWGWSEPGTNSELELTDPDHDLIYSLTIDIDAISHYEYKYFINSGWQNGEWDAGKNRSFDYNGNAMILSDVYGDIKERPAIKNHQPVDEAIDIELNDLISISFDMNLSEIDLAKIIITPDPGNVSANFEQNNTSSILINHDELIAATTYTVTIPAGSVKGAYSSLSNEAYSWSFTTRPEVEPCKVTFNVDMSNAESFDPENDELYITGSFCQWMCPGDNAIYRLTRNEMSQTYSIELDFYAAQAYE